MHPLSVVLQSVLLPDFPAVLETRQVYTGSAESTDELEFGEPQLAAISCPVVLASRRRSNPLYSLLLARNQCDSGLEAQVCLPELSTPFCQVWGAF